MGVFGVSVDSVYSHTAFAEHLGGLPYELIADFERRLVDAWGVRRTDLEGYDGVPRRSVFILDPQRKVTWRWVTSPEQRLPDVAQILAEAKKVAKEASDQVAKKVAQTMAGPAKPLAKRRAKPQAKTTTRATGRPIKKPGRRSAGSEGGG